MWKKGVLYRTTGVTLQELVQHYKAQGNLFGNADKSDKFEAIHKELDTLENKLGKKLVHLASTQNALEHRTEGTDRDDPDRNLLFL
jgi:enoyl reductase-like protein